jgi:hypothetical protein
MIAQVASRDCSSRADGTPASFLFNCNFPPSISSVAVSDTIADVDPNDPFGPEACKLVTWVSEDFEDGLATQAEVRVDDTLTLSIGGQQQSTIVPERVFRALSPGPLHSVKVRVIDRAGIFAAPGWTD